MSFIEVIILLIVEGALMIASFLMGAKQKSPVQVIREKVQETRQKKAFKERTQQAEEKLQEQLKIIDEYDGY